jgi:hypothetical protein
MKNDENETGIPDFIFCGVCLAPRDVYCNIDDLWVVEECEFCGDEHYAYSIEDDTPNKACSGWVGVGGIFKPFSGFGLILPSERIHARPPAANANRYTV